MAGFQDLSIECMAIILSYLRPYHVEELAKTFNKRITNLCLPLLERRVQTARNHRTMKRLFGDPSMGQDSQSNYESLLGNHAEFSIPEHPTEHLEYLHMDGHLDWLTPLDEHTEDQMAPHWRGAIETAAVKRLRVAARELGIYNAVPDAFWKLIGDADLQARVPSASANYFTLGPLCRILTDDLVEILKTEEDRCIPRELSADEETWVRETRAYILDFYSDQQGCGYWHLYIDSEGHHCVLSSPSQILCGWSFDTDGDNAGPVIRRDPPNEKERHLDVQVANSDNVRDLCLEATDFETWLAFSYFSERSRFMWFQQDKDEDEDIMVPGEVATFLENVYTERGRKQQLLS